MKNVDGYSFWCHVDECLRGEKLTDLAKDSGLSYNTVRNQRSQNVLPNGFDILSLANALGVSVEYLLTGKEPAPRYARIQDIIDWLMTKSDAELDVFRQYNHVPREKGISSSSRQEA